MIAFLADEALLNPADALPHAPRLGTLDHSHRPLVGEHLAVVRDRLPHRHHPVDRRWGLKDRQPPRLPEVLLDQSRQFGIEPWQLLLVDAHHERHQRIQKLTRSPANADESVAGHSPERLPCAHWLHSRAGCDLPGRLELQPHLSCQRCLLWSEDPRQHAKLDSTLSRWEAVRNGVQRRGKLPVHVLLHPHPPQAVSAATCLAPIRHRKQTAAPRGSRPSRVLPNFADLRSRDLSPRSRLGGHAALVAVYDPAAAQVIG